MQRLAAVFWRAALTCLVLVPPAGLQAPRAEDTPMAVPRAVEEYAPLCQPLRRMLAAASRNSAGPHGKGRLEEEKVSLVRLGELGERCRIAPSGGGRGPGERQDCEMGWFSVRQDAELAARNITAAALECVGGDWLLRDARPRLSQDAAPVYSIEATPGDPNIRIRVRSWWPYWRVSLTVYPPEPEASR